MTSNTTDESFKKTHQVVGANGGQLVDDLNGKIMKEAPGHDGNVALEQSGQQRTHSEQVERDLANKGFSTRQTDEEAALDADLKKKLEQRGNPAK
ncbi:Trimethylguanosine synthase [Pseudozyma hubeiensis]|nr:Trimethylguanosine synthase [Pseudozyma hubeiensis]